MAYLRRNHLALIALFVVLGGTSYAAVKLAPNSISTREVKNHSLLRKDFAARQLRPVRGARGIRGSQGQVGTTGAAGATGPKGAIGPTGPVGPIVSLPGWTAPALGTEHCESTPDDVADSAWLNDGPDLNGSTDSVGYYTDPLGLVHLKGRVKASIQTYSGDHPCPLLEIFTLPAGKRPALSEMFTVWSGTPTPSEGPARIDVQADGKVIVENPAPTTVGDGYWFSLDGIVVRTD